MISHLKYMQNFKCPKCQQIGARKSYSYPYLLVHKCNGQTLEEVAKITEPDGSKSSYESYYCLLTQSLSGIGSNSSLI